MKETTDAERRVYERSRPSPPSRRSRRPFSARRSAERRCEGGTCELRLRDVTFGFAAPCVMDVKLGTRTFGEAEASNRKRRPDLAQKMHKLDATALSADELRPA